MIHSLAGGVIKDAGEYTFVKVEVDGDTSPHWYISDIELYEGDRVIVPVGRLSEPRTATVLRVEANVSGQVTPIPLRAAKKIIAKQPLDTEQE